MQRAPHSKFLGLLRHRSWSGRTLASTALAVAGVVIVVLFALRLVTQSDRTPSEVPEGAVHEQTLPAEMEALASPTVPEVPEDAGTRRSSVPATGFSTDQGPNATIDGTRAPALDLTILWDDGTPITIATVVIAANETVLRRGNTSDGGRVSFQPITETHAEVIVLQGSSLAGIVPLERTSGDVRIELPLLGAVGGIVHIDGAVPEIPITLELKTATGGHGPGLPPPFLREEVGVVAGLGMLTLTETDAEGHFLFGALPLDWSGSLTPWNGSHFQAGETSLVLAAPATGLLLDLRSPASIRGRVLSPEGTPVAECPIEGEFVCDKETSGISWAGEEDGSFSVPLTCEGATSASLFFSAAGVGFTTVDCALDPIRGVDLGDVTLEPARAVTFHVTETDGTPIEGAEISWIGGTLPPTGADGLRTLDPFPRTGLDVRVVALGHASKRLFVGPQEGIALGANASLSDAPPVEVELQSSTSLAVSFWAPDGSLATGVRLVLEGSPLYETNKLNVDLEQGRLGASTAIAYRFKSVGDGSEFPTSIVTFSQTAPGRTFVTQLNSDVPIELSATDAFGAELDWHDSVVLTAGKTLEVEAVITLSSRTLHGLVLGDQDQPVAGATVSFPNTSQPNIETDSQGSFEVGPINAELIDVLVTAPGYAPSMELDIPTSNPLTVRLRRGRRHTVRVIDTNGSPLRPDIVSALQGNTHLMWGVETANGGSLFENLPFDPVNLQIEVGGRSYSRQASVRSETVLEVPVPGHLIVHWKFASPPGQRSFLSVHSATNPPANASKPLPAGRLTEGTLEFPVLFPGTFEVSLIVLAGGILKNDLPSEEVEIRSGETSEVSLGE